MKSHEKRHVKDLTLQELRAAYDMTELVMTMQNITDPEDSVFKTFEELKAEVALRNSRMN